MDALDSVATVAVMALAGSLILRSTARHSPGWWLIVAFACATNAFSGLAETVIMVQSRD
jgi:hypothetical protein